MPTVASSVDLVVHLTLDHDHTGTRRVEEVVAVPGRVENDVIENEPLFDLRDGRLQRLPGMPSRLERFSRHGIDVHRLLTDRG
jgi:pilus assembly protein CpaF